MATISQKMERYIDGALTKFFMFPHTETKKPRLRVSSFPYCPIKNYFQLADGLQDLAQITAQSDYFTSVGTTVHSILQRWLGTIFVGREGEEEQQGHMFGEWFCPTCKTKPKLTIIDDIICPDCGNFMEYKELFGMWKGGAIGGHTDGIFVDGDDWWVIDYKTTSKSKVDSWRRNPKRTNNDASNIVLPYYANVKQIESYCVLFENRFKHKIKGWILVYLCRDNPFYSNGRAVVAHAMDDDEKDKVRKRLDKYTIQFNTFHESLRDNNKEGIHEIVDTRPCKKGYPSYTKLMHNDFDPCPLMVGPDGKRLNVDFCSDTDSLHDLIDVKWKAARKSYRKIYKLEKVE